MSQPGSPNPYQAPQSYGDVPRKFPLGAMSLGDILSRSMTLLFSRLPVFFLIELAAYFPLLAFIIFSGVSQPEMMFQRWYGVVLIFVNYVLAQFAAAAVLKVVEQAHIDQRLGVGEALSYALSRGLPLIVTSIVMGLVVGVGFLLCVIPGILFMVMYVFAPQACVLERLGPINAMNRSQILTQGFRGRVLGLLLIVIGFNVIITLIVQFGLVVAFPILARAQGVVSINTVNLLVVNLVPALANILIGTYFSICLTLTYFDLRVRKEGFDVARAAKGDIAPGASAASWQ
jgi:hypothetical protein